MICPHCEGMIKKGQVTRTLNGVTYHFYCSYKAQEETKCVCGHKSPSIEDADWVINGVSYCSMECYDEAIKVLLLEMENNPETQKAFQETISFHIK